MAWFYIFGLLLCHSNRLTGLLSVALALPVMSGLICCCSPHAGRMVASGPWGHMYSCSGHLGESTCPNIPNKSPDWTTEAVPVAFGMCWLA